MHQYYMFEAGELKIVNINKLFMLFTTDYHICIKCVCEHLQLFLNKK